MADETGRKSPEEQAEQRMREILRAAASWAHEAPDAPEPRIQAVSIRLAEGVSDQRHYLGPLPEPRESERSAVLALSAERLRAPEVTRGIEQHLQSLAELELRSTGSWSLVAGAQSQWIDTAIRYLEGCGRKLPAGDQPDPYWADDVVA